MERQTNESSARHKVRRNAAAIQSRDASSENDAPVSSRGLEKHSLRNVPFRQRAVGPTGANRLCHAALQVLMVSSSSSHNVSPTGPKSRPILHVDAPWPSNTQFEWCASSLHTWQASGQQSSHQQATKSWCHLSILPPINQKLSRATWCNVGNRGTESHAATYPLGPVPLQSRNRKRSITPKQPTSVSSLCSAAWPAGKGEYGSAEILRGAPAVLCVPRIARNNAFVVVSVPLLCIHPLGHGLVSAASISLDPQKLRGPESSSHSPIHLMYACACVCALPMPQVAHPSAGHLGDRPLGWSLG